MPLAKAEEHVLACACNKIDNRKTRRVLHETNLEIKRGEVEILSKNIPRDRRFERIQVTCRLRAKLDAKKRKNSCL